MRDFIWIFKTCICIKEQKWSRGINDILFTKLENKIVQQCDAILLKIIDQLALVFYLVRASDRQS